MRDESEQDPEDRPVWAWIDLDALRHNAARALEAAGDRSVIGVVKADGYGHGAISIARGLLAAGVSRLAVVSIGEAAALRRAGIVAPILVMGELGEADAIERAMKWNLTPVLHSRDDLERVRPLVRARTPLAVEVEVDTGMHRMGVGSEEAGTLLRDVVSTAGLSLAGVYTHLASADQSDPAPAKAQVERFSQVLAQVLGAASVSGQGTLAHAANSAGLLRIDEIEGAVSGFKSEAVRPGLMLYGVSPFPERSGAELGLRPVMSLGARVVAVRDVAAGEAVGYGATWCAPAGGARIATIPLGYADGLPRALASQGHVFLAGADRPIVGRVSMDYITVDVSGSSAEAGSVATIFGAAADGRPVPVESLAAAAGTIGYEMLTAVGPRVPRRVGEGPPPMADPGDLDRAV